MAIRLLTGKVCGNANSVYFRISICSVSAGCVKCIIAHSTAILGTAVAQWLRCCAKNLKVTGSVLDGIIVIFH